MTQREYVVLWVRLIFWFVAGATLWWVYGTTQ